MAEYPALGTDFFASGIQQESYENLLITFNKPMV